MILRQGGRAWVLTSGLAVLTAGVILILAASETTTVVANQDLTQSWRTSYDILVRPPGTRSAVEERENLVEANHLSGIPGGITFNQYETIRQIPGIDVAAPIAMLGYLAESIPIGDFKIALPGIYELNQTILIDNGATVARHPYGSAFYYLGPQTDIASAMGFNVNLSLGLRGEVNLPFLIAGIDPAQEAALVGLDQAVVEGRYLSNEEPFTFSRSTDPFGKTITQVENLPVLINSTPYISFTLSAELRRPLLPPEVTDLADVRARGGITWVRELPSESVTTQTATSATVYQLLLDRLLTTRRTQPAKFRILHSFAYSIPSPIEYRLSDASLTYGGQILEIIPPTTMPSLYGEPAYRISPDPSVLATEFGFKVWFTLQAKGAFDIERLPRPEDINRVPLETYFPPVAKLIYDETGHPVEPQSDGIDLHPTLSPAGYLQSPPLLLTTLAAARVLAGDACISAVRVRVADIERLTPEAQRKIEAIATEIHRRTGLTVDVLVGSSPTRVLVHIPQLGYVEEHWIRKGVNVALTQRIQNTQLLLLAIPLIIGVFFTLDLAWADVLSRYRTIALMKALGWRSKTVFSQTVAQGALLGATGAVSGALIAWGLMQRLGWHPLSKTLLMGVPLLTLGLCLIGNLYPAWLAARRPPILDLQGFSVKYSGKPASRPRGMWRYAWLWLWRRASRAFLSGLAAALSSALLVLLLGTTLAQQGYLTGTLLGEYILMHIEGYHYAIVGLGFLLAAPAMGHSLLIGMMERRGEVGLLKAVGWRSTTVVGLFLMEGMTQGLIGGLVGTLIGLETYLVLYGILGLQLGWAVLAGLMLPMGVGLIAAIYPAWVAARVPPAEGIRS